MALTPEQRTLRARKAALTRWSRNRPESKSQRLQDDATLDDFRRQVLNDDPTVVEPELSRRAECLRKAEAADLAFRTSKAQS